MATNLVSVVMQFLTPDMIAKIASALGLDRNVAQKAIAGAIPALLASLADVASTPNGARQLTNTLTQQSGSLDSLKNLTGDRDLNSFAETGSNMLSGLFGGGTLDAMAQTIGKFAGIGEGTTKSMLGMLGPVVLGALGQQQRSAGLDASGLASLLTSQKDQIAAAIPFGLAGQLSAAGLIDGATESLRSGAAAASTAGSRIAGASERTISGAGQAAAAAARRTAVPQWPYWLVAAVVLGGLIWFALGRPGEDTVAQMSPPSTKRTETGTVGKAPTDLTVDGMNLANQINSSVGSIRIVLSSITDAASAEAALPKLKEATDQLDEVGSRATQLSPEGKSTLVKLVVVATPMINQMCDKVLATPGAGDVAKPAIDELRGKLDALARS
ncbi:DUF937 domain-containing protein [Bradyrhizobium valentinum]|uniref:DUF937 domain-containing protein n=1 Tax=Bradyrhizobium valentinum TaxID=1518501 RepID=A0A0R3LK78_9BRAD|nr:DUF937 domain-containing protein [Bradyrhizobium valentinum]KRR01894.1 hypothetical protein CP49_38940 [Bradyrhizobium valentinum]KRR07534.1 hypothetical protein CQ10_15765 [Bradyrhizobium valentinum]